MTGLSGAFIFKYAAETQFHICAVTQSFVKNMRRACYIQQVHFERKHKYSVHWQSIIQKLAKTNE